VLQRPQGSDVFPFLLELKLGGVVLDEKHAASLVIDRNVLLGNLELPFTLAFLLDLELGERSQKFLGILDLHQAESRVTRI